MKIVYHQKFREVYSTDPASSPGRIEAIMDELDGRYPIVEAEPAKMEDLMTVHSRTHIERIKKDPHLFEIASLSAGGAIKCAMISYEGEVTFGVIRPPGHHAGRESSWGFCYFNNIALAVKKLLLEKKIDSALIVDFDLHFGDGTASIFKGSKNVIYYHMPDGDSKSQISHMVEFLKGKRDFGILAVSAGFDRGKRDWGGTLDLEDYTEIGKILKEESERISGGLRFAVLEGGYNHSVLGKNVLSFLKGFA